MRSKLHNSDLTPVISTERFQLRLFHKSDAAQIQLLANDWDVARMLRTMPHPYPDGAAELWLENTAGSVERRLLRRYALTKREDGLLIGCLTLRKRLEAETEAELSYWLGKPYWGRGYITEAIRAALSDATVTFGLTCVRATALPTNQRSIRVLEKLGFVSSGVTKVDGFTPHSKTELFTYKLKLGSDWKS